MATHVISNNRKTIWNINENGDTWIVQKNASIVSSNFAAIYENGPFSGNTIKVLGDLTVLGGGDGLLIEGTGTRTTIGARATVTAINAIHASGSNQRIVNDGELYGAVSGIYASGPGLRIDNDGTIFGTIAMELHGDDLSVVNGASGVIAAELGISTFSNTRVEIINKGRISGESAIQIEDGTTQVGSAHIVNTGKIYGTIALGDGDDIFDSLKGKAVTTIFGGDGDDVFLLSDSDIGIVESAGEGSETVKSTVSYVLFEHVENLTLLGKNNIDGEGNDGGNVLIGNKGRNTLLGFDGIDVLNGGRGNDTLDGGDDDTLDLYVFNRGTGKDVVAIFEDGFDLISLARYDGIDGFEDIEVAQDGADTLVILLDGDRVRIKNFTATNLTDDDVAFEIF